MPSIARIAAQNIQPNPELSLPSQETSCASVAPPVLPLPPPPGACICAAVSAEVAPDANVRTDPPLPLIVMSILLSPALAAKASGVWSIVKLPLQVSLTNFFYLRTVSKSASILFAFRNVCNHCRIACACDGVDNIKVL